MRPSRARAVGLIGHGILAFVGGSLTAALDVAAQPARPAGNSATPNVAPVRVRASTSVEIRRRDQAIFQSPSSDSPRRGTTELGAHLPLLGVVRGAGCAGGWLQVDVAGYVCADDVTLSDWPATSDPAERGMSVDGLPYRYAFVSKDGTFGYNALETAEDGVPVAQLQPGFGVALERVRDKPGTSDAFGLTTHGFWVPLHDLLDVRPTYFHGSAWNDALGWTIAEAAPLFAPPGKRRAGRTLPRLTTVLIEEQVERAGVSYARVSEHDWLRASDLRRPQRSAPPAEITEGERWLDVDLKRQTLVAYAGTEPQFATLVSTGRGPMHSETATPPGSFRIWVKLRTSDMDNIEDAAARENYAIEAVPWVMFFSHGYGLHGTFWHQRFGETKSHGCVNLAPRDAEWLFGWSRPRLPPGWSAVLPTASDAGTLVRVRAE